MDDLRRQQLNIRVIRVSLSGAQRNLPPEKVRHVVDRASAMLAEARRKATNPDVIREIDALQIELDQQTVEWDETPG